MQMSLVDARTITEAVPEDLSALLIARFPIVGQTVNLCAVGDIGFSGRVSLRPHKEFEATLAEVAPVLKAADITFGNLETPLTEDLAPGKLFSAPVSSAALLKSSGFNLIHLANNHVYDYGSAGFVATIDAVTRAGLVPLGVGGNVYAAQNMVRTDINDIRIGWLGCGRTLVEQSNVGPNYWEFDEQELLNAVKRNREEVDVLIVSIHIGLMYMDYPRPEHKKMAERLFAAGTNLILMHHAHVLQSVQVSSQRSVCCYNLGNFVFDWEEGNVKIPTMVREQNEGAIFHFVVDRMGIAQVAALPVWIDESCKVRWAAGMHGIKILNRLIRISQDLDGDLESLFKRQRAERNTSGIFKVMWFHTVRGNWAFIADSLKKIRLEHLGMILRWLISVLQRGVRAASSRFLN